MVFLRRLGFYLIGFSIGLLFLAYFLKEKRTQFCYTPTCRVLKEIRSKKITYTSEALLFLQHHAIDSSQVRDLLKEGNVIFSQSQPRKKPCAVYTITGMIQGKKRQLSVENCEEARIKTLQ